MEKLFYSSALFLTLLLVVSCGSDSSGPNPEVTGIQPTSGPPGASVTISGKGFRSKSNMEVTFGGASATLISATKDQIQTEVPAGLSEGSAPVEVTVKGKTVSGPNFNVEAKAPGITSIEPDSGTVGTEVTIKGMNFSSNTSEVSISFDGTSAQVRGAAQDQLITEVPQGANDGPIEVTVKQKSTTSPTFDVINEGTIRVITKTLGNDQDTDRYDLFIDGTDRGSIANVGKALFPDLKKGDYQLDLADVKSNCTVQGANPRTLTVKVRDTTETTFNVDCTVPTENKIVFHSDRDTDREIYMMDADGSGVQKLSDNSSFDGRPVISNSGKYIAFQSSRNGSNNLFIMDGDGNNVRQVTNTSSLTLYFTWSSDDSKLALTDAQGGDLELYTINADGTGMMQLTNNTVDERDPTWSPDGSKIAFTTERSGDREIFLINPDGSNLTQLTSGTADNVNPRWSPDGSKILFSSNRGSSFDLYTMNPDGSNVQQITTHADNEQRPSWSPDGSEILFRSNRTGDYEIFKMNADGSGTATNLTMNSASDVYSFWSPVK